MLATGTVPIRRACPHTRGVRGDATDWRSPARMCGSAEAERESGGNVSSWLRGARSALNQVPLGTAVAQGREHHEVVLCLDSGAIFEERALITEGRRWL